MNTRPNLGSEKMSGRLRYAMKVSLPKCVLKKSYYRFYLPVNLDKKYYGFLIKKKTCCRDSWPTNHH